MAGAPLARAECGQGWQGQPWQVSPGGHIPVAAPVTPSPAAGGGHHLESVVSCSYSIPCRQEGRKSHFTCFLPVLPRQGSILSSSACPRGAGQGTATHHGRASWWQHEVRGCETQVRAT